MPLAATAPQMANASASCPECGELRTPNARFCDTCRYDFQTRAPYTPSRPSDAVPANSAPPPAPVQSRSPSIDPPIPLVAASPVPADGLLRWELHAVVDLSLKTPDTPAPVDLRDRLYPIDFDENLIGRTSPKQNVFPEVALLDPGVSRRHAKLLKAPDGTLALLDLGTENGTSLNGAVVAPNVPTPLKDGDQIVLGCWTRLTLRGR